MKTVDFRAHIAPGAKSLFLPKLRRVPAGEEIDVVLRWEVSEGDQAWRDAGRRRFESAHAPEDSVYDELIDP